jgi:hypothetical protein
MAHWVLISGASIQVYRRDKSATGFLPGAVAAPLLPRTVTLSPSAGSHNENVGTNTRIISSRASVDCTGPAATTRVAIAAAAFRSGSATALTG